ncbi:hypothetical protein CAEBREN_02703 [Caenorhabditis brenneri]|uniref:F-box domain-containing protein n=1 Tax=Caenorhabditis brenneri TaxID=135651 RepID=G0N1G5_CAEBE|nr:hypothetical protein CAEBREN_02703 [Caenorhabditis brenneri]
MEADNPTLLQMPEVIMGHILDKLDLPDILILRKTCHHLRNLIDDLHPDPKIARSVIIVDTDFIEFKMNLDKDYDWYPEGKLLRIKYSDVVKPKNGSEACKVQWFRSDRSREKFVEGLSFIAHFCRDFEFIFGAQSPFEFSQNPRNPSRIQDFILNLEYFPPDHFIWEAITHQLLPSLESTLKNRPRPLPVKEFYTTVYEKSHVFQILPCFEPKTLEKISISHRPYIPERVTWELDEFSELEQWKIAKVLWVFDVSLAATVQEFKDFEEINVKLGEVKVEEVLELKETILNSTSNLTTGKIEFYTCDGEQHFLQTYGYPFTDIDMFGDDRRCWFFKIPNKKFILQISFYRMYLRFALVENPPKNAMVQ